ncbi:MAG: glycosyltransferase family A protein [Breznakibacter sp.]
MPKVSIVIPTYQRTSYLGQTLESILHQTFQDFEIIVVDDGTPGDDNLLLCQAFEKVRYIKIENSGSPIRPRNVGIGLAMGKYVAFADDDDIWLPQKLEKQVAALDQNPGFGLVHGYCKIIDRFGRETGEIAGRLNNPMLKHGYVFDRMVGRFTVMMSTPLIRKEVLDKAGLFNENMAAAGEDMEFYCRVAFYTPFYFLDEPLVLYRVHEGGISRNNFAYNYLPLVLFNTISVLRRRERIDFAHFNRLRKQLMHMQLGLVKDARTYWLAFANCLRMAPLLVFFPSVVWGIILRFRVDYLLHPKTKEP